MKRMIFYCTTEAELFDAEISRNSLAVITWQEWVLDGGGHGESFVVRRQRFVYANRDLTHPAWLLCLDRICDRAVDFDVAGLVWDEPSFGLGFIEETFPISGRRKLMQKGVVSKF